MSVGRLKIWNASASAWEYVNAPDPGATQADIDAAITALSTVYQPLDSDLTAIAALTTTSFGRAFLTLANAAAARTAIGTVIGTDVEAHDPDLTTIAGLSPTNDDLLQRKAGAWANRTIAQLLVDLAAAGTTFQPLDSDLTAIAALTTTTYGRAFLALADAAAGRTALGLGTLATQSGTFSGTSSGTNTGDQTTVSGNAGTATALQTGRTIDGQTFDGTANITVIAPGTHAATGKTTPADADEVPLVDSAASNVLKRLTWANLKATLKTYFDTLYPSGSGTSTGTNTGDQTISDATISTTDITTNNVTTSKHGFAPKAPNDATKFLDGTGAYSVPPGGAPSGSAGGDLTGTYPNPTLATAGPGATGPIGDSSHVPAVTIDAKGRVTALSSVSPTLGAGVFGDGSDGTVTFDGSSVVLGLTPASNVYTLTRDIFLAAGTINSGVSIVPGGFRIYCAGTLTNNGTIRSNGASSTTATGANGVLNVATSSFLSTSVVTGTTGGNAGSAAVGGNGGTQNSSLNAMGGVGGVGGTAGANAGGSGGALTVPTAAKGTLRAVPQAGAGLFILGGTTSGAVQLVAGGTGGGGGAGSGQGGGGGGGGGVMFVSARVFAGTGAIQARGGNGANGQSGNSGGGGGGGGGLVLVVSQSVSAGAISGQTIDANGGTKGAPIGTGTNNATDGAVGTVILVPN